MDKYTFENELRARLSDLPKGTTEVYIRGYSDIIGNMMRSGLTEEQAVASMGSPDVVAARIRSAAAKGNPAYAQSSPDFVPPDSRNYGDSFNEEPDTSAGNVHETVTGTVIDPPNRHKVYPQQNMSSEKKALRIILIVIACFLFLPAVIGMYIGAVSMFIAGLGAFGIGFIPLFAGAAARGVLAMGAGLLVMGLAILFTMGLNRLLKLITGQYRLIK